MTVKWPIVPLSAIVQREERAISPQPNVVYRQAGVRLWGGGAYERESITGSETKYTKLFRVETDDLIFNKIWARNGSVAVVQNNLHGCYVSAEFPVFSLLKKHVDPKWMSLLTRTQSFWSECDKRSHGSSGQNRIKPKEILTIPIPIPPISEQQRIVRLLDAAEELRRLRERADRRTADLVPALFHEMFGDPVSNPKGWQLASVRNVAGVQGGITLGQHRGSFRLRKPYLRVANVQRGYLKLDDVKEIGLSDDEYGKVKLAPGDLLIVEGNGNPQEIGRAAIWNGSIADCVHQNHLIRIRADAAILVPEYLLAFLNSDAGRHYFLGSGKTTSGLVTINTTVVKACRIPLPPRPLQETFAARVAEVRAMEAKQAESRRRLDDLFHSLLHRAFRGEL